MKSLTVTEFKAHLSRYLRMASRGTRIVVRDRDDPIAEVGPARAAAGAWWERLANEGRLRPGTQDWGRWRRPKPVPRSDIQAALRAVREEPDEIRRR